MSQIVKIRKKNQVFPEISKVSKRGIDGFSGGVEYGVTGMAY